MDMSNITQRYFTKLRIISKIPINGQLCTANNELNIYIPNIYNWLWRKWNSDGKQQTTKNLIEFYEEINKLIDQIITRINTVNTYNEKIKHVEILVSLVNKMIESLDGIRNLKETYKNFYKTTSELECIEFDIIIPKIKIVEKFLNSNSDYNNFQLIKRSLSDNTLKSKINKIFSYSDKDTATDNLQISKSNSTNNFSETY